MKRTHSYLILLLGAIFLDEISDNYILGLLAARPAIQDSIFTALFFGFQILFSPFQAGHSDFYCRKKSLLIALTCSFVSLLVLFLYFGVFLSPFLLLFIVVFAKGALGNILPIAWAGIADTKNRDYRFSLGLSTSIIACGYLALLIIDYLFSDYKSLIIICLLFAIIIFLIGRNFEDLVDRKAARDNLIDQHNLAISPNTGELKKIFNLMKLDYHIIKEKFLKSTRFQLGLFGTFLLIEISFYSTHALGVDLIINNFKIVTFSMILGYLAGVGILRFCKNNSDENMIKTGFKISLFSFAPLFLYAFLFSITNLEWIITICYFVYSIGVAFIVPSLFSILSSEREPHEQGKIYGLIDSTDTIALLVAIFAGIIYNNLKLNQITIVLFSFITIVASTYFYAKFAKTKKEA